MLVQKNQKWKTIKKHNFDVYQVNEEKNLIKIKQKVQRLLENHMFLVTDSCLLSLAYQ